MKLMKYNMAKNYMHEPALYCVLLRKILTMAKFLLSSLRSPNVAILLNLPKFLPIQSLVLMVLFTQGNPTGDKIG